MRPTVKLRPKADAKRIRFGHPWAWSDEIAFDRRTKALAPGTLVRLEESGGKPLGTAAMGGGARIAARILDRDAEAEIDAAWIKARLRTALSHRERLYDAPFYRLIHAEADGLPGVVVDRFGEAAVLQPNAAWAAEREEAFATALNALGMTTVIRNGAGRARAEEGLDGDTAVLRGEQPQPIPVPMNGATYVADLMGGQKTGLFYDQRPNHAFTARLAEGARVLDVFSHVGGFGLAALAGGAAEAVLVDASRAALDLAEDGARRMGRTVETRQGDAFETLAAMASERFDLVICDPPAFAPSKGAREAGLRAYERIARLSTPLVEAGGYLVLCSCSHAADLAAFRTASIRGIGRAGRSAQLIHTGFAGPDHPVHPALPESGYLKALFFRILA